MGKKKQLISVIDNYDEVKVGEFVSEFDCEWAHTDRLKYDYELTVTFNHRLHTKASATEAYKELVQKILSYHYILVLNVSIEYQKNGFPHYHCHLMTDTPITGEERWNTMKAFERHFGITSFKPAIDRDAFQKYYTKDSYENYKKHGFEHLIQYIQKD